MIKFILVYYLRSKYLGMEKRHIEIFNNMEELVKFREAKNIKKYEIYKQII